VDADHGLANFGRGSECGAQCDPGAAPAIAAACGVERRLATRARPAARGQTREALSIIERAGWIQAARATPLEAYDRLLRAQLLEQLGRDDEALEFYAQFSEGSPYDLPFSWQVELGMARIAERRGDRAGAARWYRSVATRLRDADLPLRPQAGRATTLAVALR